MTRSERRQLFRSLEQKVLGGEPKGAILADESAGGRPPRDVARLLVLIPSRARRRRCRLFNWLLLALLLVAVVRFVTSPSAELSSDARWLLLELAAIALIFALPVPSILRYRSPGYAGAGVAAGLSLYWTVRPLVGHADRIDAGVVANLVLFASLIVLATLLPRALFPDFSWWSNEPRVSSAGEYSFVD